MKRQTDKKLPIFIASITSLFYSQSAFAYLDPGTGSFILQMLVAGFLGGMLYIKLTWTRIKVYWAGLFKEQSVTDAEEQEGEKSEPAK